MRARIAREMQRSSSEVPQVTLNSEADVSSLLELRRRLRDAEHTAHVSINDIIVKAAAHTVRDMPLFRSFLIGDMLYEQEKVDIGIAVAVDEGLLVPVIRDADILGLGSLARTSAELIGRARDGRLKAEELEGGVFTVSNLGMYGIRSFTPMILMPQSAILGVNAVFQRPELKDGELENRDCIGLSLTIDHRVIDGAQAAVFLQKTGYLLEHPELLLAL
jgi:pyruvate dehydrogenase E2 component (dihydrolipoamide acetyltransferase)